MKEFSNETKSKRRKAVLKVILKRYSFIIWLPLLLCISYKIGQIAGPYLDKDGAEITYYSIGDKIVLTILGFSLLVFLLTICCGIIGIISYFIIIPIKENGFFDALKGFLKFISEKLLNLYELLKDFSKFIVKLLLNLFKLLPTILKSPMYLCKRIKDEKRRFQNAVEEQIFKDNQQKFGEINC